MCKPAAKQAFQNFVENYMADCVILRVWMHFNPGYLGLVMKVYLYYC